MNTINNSICLFVHIPKTAGTSLRIAFEQALGKESVYYDYGKTASETSALVSDLLYGEIPDSYRLFEYLGKCSSRSLIAGHFGIKRYSHFILAKNIATFVRDPVQQVISHYYHFKRHGGYKQSLEVFCRQPQFRNLQNRSFNNYPLNLIGFIGLTEKFTISLQLLAKLWNISIEELKLNFNQQRTEELYQVEPATEQLIKQQNRQDMRLYAKALARFEQQYSEYEQSGYYLYRSDGLKNVPRGISGWCYYSHSDHPVKIEVLNSNGVVLYYCYATEFQPQLAQFNPVRGGCIGYHVPKKYLTEPLTVQSSEGHVLGEWQP
ncbi:hypothetical protein D5085_02130 [Ectothiorhodospiraceae bacterium BW-2]|nr:hypothetical protein D5085_02130 [Ectothiorhodospiraceae bacterium BW-2]